LAFQSFLLRVSANGIVVEVAALSLATRGDGRKDGSAASVVRAASLRRRGNVTSRSALQLETRAGACAVITGGLGLIGSAIARRLVALGVEPTRIPG
jgi:FlaA1/EpsC-like NDP-sugar epimerase